MAVVSSGEIKLIGDVNLEVNDNITDTDVSLTTLSTGAGFTAPHGLTEFYDYTAVALPSVTTNAISSIASTSMTLNGDVTGDGGGTISERGFYFGTDNSSATNNTKYTVSGTTGAFTLAQTGLTTGTTYYAWAFATNEAGTTIASVQSATPALVIQNLLVSYHSYGTSSSNYNTATYRNYYDDGAGGWTLQATVTQSSGWFGVFACRQVFADGIQNRLYVTGVSGSALDDFVYYGNANAFGAGCDGGGTPNSGTVTCGTKDANTWNYICNGGNAYWTV